MGSPNPWLISVSQPVSGTSLPVFTTQNSMIIYCNKFRIKYKHWNVLHLFLVIQLLASNQRLVIQMYDTSTPSKVAFTTAYKPPRRVCTWGYRLHSNSLGPFASSTSKKTRYLQHGASVCELSLFITPISLGVMIDISWYIYS